MLVAFCLTLTILAVEPEPMREGDFARRLSAKGARVELSSEGRIVSLSIKGATWTAHDLDAVNKCTAIEALALIDTSVDSATVSRICANCTLIKVLKCNGSRIDDSALPAIGGLKKLEWLSLSDTAVTSRGLSHLRGLRALQVLHLQRTRIDDEACKSISSIPSLQVLWLSGTPVSDAGVAELHSLSVRELLLNGTNISDNALKDLGRIRTLEVVRLCDTSVTSAGIAHLASLHKLRYLGISNTEVDINGLRTLKHLPHWKDIPITGSKVRLDELRSLSDERNPSTGRDPE